MKWAFKMFCFQCNGYKPWVDPDREWGLRDGAECCEHVVPIDQREQTLRRGHDGLELEEKREIKHLGIHFNNQLKFIKHIDTIKNRLREIRQTISYLKSVYSPKYLLKLAFSLAYGKLNFGFESLPGLSNTEYSEITTHLSWILSDIMRIKNTYKQQVSHRLLFRKAGWPSIKEWHKKCILTTLNNNFCAGKPDVLFERIENIL